VGILAHALAKTARSKKYRDALRAGTLALISAGGPKAGFNVGLAMTRNKYLYALGDWSLAISSALKTGGTWAGATDNLKHQWSPLFVRSTPEMPAGNKALIEQGAIPIDEATLHKETSLRDWLAEQSSLSQKPVQSVKQLSLLDWQQE
jgi:predicted Rossmann fold nucleotide-binding protein DprA/Smf involved in DNA uptake